MTQPPLEDVLAGVRTKVHAEGKDQAIRDFAKIFTNNPKWIRLLKEMAHDVDDKVASLVLFPVAMRRAEYFQVRPLLLGLWCTGYTAELLTQIRVELGLDRIERKQRATTMGKVHSDKADQPAAGPIVARDPSEIEHDKKVLDENPQTPGESQSQKGQRRTGDESQDQQRRTGDESQDQQQRRQADQQKRQQQAKSQGYSIEIPGMGAVTGSALQDFEQTELNQPVKEFTIVATTSDAALEEWNRQTELYKDEPTASSYRKDITLRTLDDNGKETNQHLIKGVYPKRRTEKENGVVEYLMAGDFIATSSQTRQEHGEQGKAPRSKNLTDDPSVRPTNPSKPSPKSEG